VAAVLVKCDNPVVDMQTNFIPNSFFLFIIKPNENLKIINVHFSYTLYCNKFQLVSLKIKIWIHYALGANYNCYTLIYGRTFSQIYIAIKIFWKPWRNVRPSYSLENIDFNIDGPKMLDEKVRINLLIFFFEFCINNYIRIF